MFALLEALQGSFNFLRSCVSGSKEQNQFGFVSAMAPYEASVASHQSVRDSVADWSALDNSLNNKTCF